MSHLGSLSFVAVLSVAFAGCASSPPPWHGRFLDDLSRYYDQGTGGGKTLDQADRNARIALVGYRQGIEIESVTEDQVQSFEKTGDELIVEITTRKGVQKISGKLPPGSYIAERWQDESGTWWSYALAERPGQSRRIQKLRDARLGAARIRSIAPGWAQFTKGQKQKGWRILASEGIGVAGFAVFALLQRDYEDRRDRASASDWDYYNDWANRFYWSSVAFGTLAGATYLYSLIDGIVSVPPTYRLLLSRTDLDVRPCAQGAVLVFRYEIE